MDQSIDTGGILYQELHPICIRPSLGETVRETQVVLRGRVADVFRYVREDYATLKAECRGQGPARRT